MGETAPEVLGTASIKRRASSLQLPCCKPVIQHDLRSEAVGFPRESQQQVFQFDVGTAKHFCLFRAISQHPFTFLT